MYNLLAVLTTQILLVAIIITLNNYHHMYLLFMVYICAQWSYGVTVWEVFNGGRTPYPAIDPLSLIQLLEEGRRLERPLNAACATEM